MKYHDLTCFRCGTGFEPCFPAGNHPNLHGGLLFRSRGGFGSEYDPSCSGEELVIAVCDSCLYSDGQLGLVMLEKVRYFAPAPAAPQVWNPGVDPREEG